MEKVSTKNNKNLKIVFLSLIIITGSLFNKTTSASTLPSSLNGTQLAYFVGFHTDTADYYEYQSANYDYYHPQYFHRFYWIRSQYSRHSCKKGCLVNRWNRQIIRCNKRCY